MVGGAEGGDAVVIDVAAGIDQVDGVRDVVDAEADEGEADGAGGIDGLGQADVVVLGDPGEILAVHGPDLQVAPHAEQAGRVPITRSDVVHHGGVGTAHAQGTGTHADRKELVAVLRGILSHRRHGRCREKCQHKVAKNLSGRGHHLALQYRRSY